METHYPSVDMLASSVEMLASFVEMLASSLERDIAELTDTLQ